MGDSLLQAVSRYRKLGSTRFFLLLRDHVINFSTSVAFVIPEDGVRCRLSGGDIFLVTAEGHKPSPARFDLFFFFFYFNMDTFPRSCESLCDLFCCSQDYMVEAGIFGCLLCTYLLSAEIACEGMIINKIHMRVALKMPLSRP